jgi:hypothetical protein
VYGGQSCRKLPQDTRRVRIGQGEFLGELRQVRYLPQEHPKVFMNDGQCISLTGHGRTIDGSDVVRRGGRKASVNSVVDG